MTYYRSVYIQGVIIVAVSLSLLYGSCRNAWAVGDSQGFPDVIGISVPEGHESTRNIHSFIKGFNFSNLPDRCLYTPFFAVSKNSRDLFNLGGRRTELLMTSKHDVIEQAKSDSGSILAMAAGTISFLYWMPESFSKWPEEKKDLSPDKLWERYDKNVFSGGPVWDNDKWEINYIGHPYFGAAYYTHAMNNNYTRLESLTYSFMMSTFLYEYGLEAFFEEPSLQDIFVTPLGGAFFGEAFILMRNGIQSNDDKVLGSRILGSLCLFMLDPISATLEPINRFNEKYSKLHMESRYYSRSTITADNITSPGIMYDHRIGVEICISTNAFSR